MTTYYEVAYQLHDDRQFLGYPSHVGWCKVGGFTNRRAAETALANLALNPEFRGGHINSVTRGDEDDND
jgi:hypothetical protein